MIADESITQPAKVLSEKYGIPVRTVYDFLAQNTHKEFWNERFFSVPIIQPKILVLDIETSPVLAHVWALFKQNVGLNMIAEDWYVLSWSAKWVGSDEIFYADKRDTWYNSDDKDLLQGIWQLIDEADWVVTQNGVKFDMRKLNARFIINGMKPPKSYKNIDTLIIAKEAFGFTSNKLEYMTDKLCTKYKKMKHEKFAGFELWKECLAGNPEAWDCMETYNKYDTLSLEELYFIIRPWYKKHPNFNAYHDSEQLICTCGSTHFEMSGFHYTGVSKFTKFQCQDCGYEVRDRINLLTKEKRKSLTVGLG